MSPLEILGIGSALLALVAFVGNEYGKLKADSFWYDFLNLVSAVGLFYYAYTVGATPFMITNSVWGLVAGIDVAKYVWRKGLKRGRK